MKPQSIARLAGLFLLAVATFIALMGTYVWLEIERVSAEIRTREERSAQAEVRDGLTEMRGRALEMGQALALWNETRQQLTFSEYYTLWRDDRVEDAGMLPKRVKGVALYDKRGQILAPPHPMRPMHAELPGQAPLTLLQQEGNKSYFTLYLPVHADPGGSVLLGYAGIRFDFLDELQRARVYQYADLDSCVWTSLKVVRSAWSKHSTTCDSRHGKIPIWRHFMNFSNLPCCAW